MLHIKRVHEARKRQWGHIASNLITLGAYGFVFRPGFQSARSQLRQSRIKMMDASRVPMPKLSNKIFWQDAKDLRSEKLPCAVCGHKVRGAFKAFLSSKLGSHQTRQRHHCRLCGKIICSDCKTLMMVNHPLTSSDTERKRFLVAQEYSFKRAEWYSRTPNVVNSCIVCATCKADVARESDPELIGRLSQNTNYVENSLREILRNAYPKRGKEGCLRSQAALLVICRGDLTAVLGALIARERGGTPAYLRERFGLIN